MRVLLDTHVALWILRDAPELSASARRSLTEAEAVYVSSVSLWEVVIKAALGKLDVDLDRLQAQWLAAGIRALPLSWAHTLALRALPPLHRDPFDRMLIAQAVSEPLHLLTHDAALASYTPLVITI